MGWGRRVKDGEELGESGSRVSPGGPGRFALSRPAPQRTHLERGCRATGARAARSGAAGGPRSNSATSSLRGEGTVSPTKQFPVVLHQLTHPSTREVFKVLAHRRFTWRF